MKIRFYHWWVYKLYFRLWSPILVERPEMVRGQVEWMTRWLDDIKARADGAVPPLKSEADDGR